MLKLKIYCLFPILIVLTSKVICNDYKVEYFDQYIDHFNFHPEITRDKDKTFQQRYLYNDTWWDVGKGPIFFYAGNEGDIEEFWHVTGFLLDIAPKFNAFVLFAEHRYYGKSLPFGKDSFKDKNVGYLSIEQVLADYTFLINDVKQRFNAQNSTVIAFGGSYGGMLATYMRFRYPYLIKGAIAASAPLYQAASETPRGDKFFQHVTEVFDSFPNCKSSVRSAFSELHQLANSGTKGLRNISETFRLSQKLKSKDFRHFLLWIRNAFATTAMINYPFANKLSQGYFPAFPVKVMCSKLVASAPIIENMFNAVSIYYNASSTSKSFDIYAQFIECADPTGCLLGLTNKAWDYQACTEVNLEGGTNGITDMFPELPFDSSMRDKYCYKTWKVLPRRNWLKTLLWGENMSSSSNIVFSNGDLDPWSVGGVLQNISETLLAINIQDGAHQLDLRGSHPEDPVSVKNAREFETKNIREWLKL